MDAEIRIDLSGFDKAGNLLSKVDVELRKACQWTIKAAKAQMMLPKHGAMVEYYVGPQKYSTKTGKALKRRTKTHIQSAPGEAPAIRTGQLYNSFFTHPGVRFLEYVVGVNAPYGRYLEEKLNRPFLISNATIIGRLLAEKVKVLLNGV
jgi:hypothetical protein